MKKERQYKVEGTRTQSICGITHSSIPCETLREYILPPINLISTLVLFNELKLDSKFEYGTSKNKCKFKSSRSISAKIRWRGGSSWLALNQKRFCFMTG
jgi:hypothetical protein